MSISLKNYHINNTQYNNIKYITQTQRFLCITYIFMYLKVKKNQNQSMIHMNITMHLLNIFIFIKDILFKYKYLQ